MTKTEDNWGFLVKHIIDHECPKCQKKYAKLGTCTRTCNIELRLVQPGERCLRDYWGEDGSGKD